MDGQLFTRTPARETRKVVLSAAVELFAPARCGGCLAPSLQRCSALCAACRARIEQAALADLGWLRLRPGMLALGAFAYEGPLAAALKRAKTPGGHSGAAPLAALLWQRLGVDPRSLVVPRTWVPSVAARARTRAVELPQVLAGPGALRLLTRVGNPPDQVGLTARQRRRAPHGSFRAVGPTPPAVILVDDVRTTGATALAAADALARAGTQRVLLITLAIARPHPLLTLF